MARPRAATVSIATLTMNCPHCDEPITSPGNYSYLIEWEEYENFPSVMQCPKCRKRFTRPVTVCGAAERPVVTTSSYTED